MTHRWRRWPSACRCSRAFSPASCPRCGRARAEPQALPSRSARAGPGATKGGAGPAACSVSAEVALALGGSSPGRVSSSRAFAASSDGSIRVWSPQPVLTARPARCRGRGTPTRRSRRLPRSPRASAPGDPRWSPAWPRPRSFPCTSGAPPSEATVVGRPPARADEIPSANYRMVSPRFFSTLGIALRRGRELHGRRRRRRGTGGGRQRAPWPGASCPTGSAWRGVPPRSTTAAQPRREGSRSWGVVGDVKHYGLDDRLPASTSTFPCGRSRRR